MSRLRDFEMLGLCPLFEGHLCHHVGSLVNTVLNLFASHHGNHHGQFSLDRKFDSAVVRSDLLDLDPEVTVDRQVLHAELHRVAGNTVHDAENDLLSESVHFESDKIGVCFKLLHFVLRNKVAYTLEVTQVGDDSIDG